jgi:hypothetical protein
MRKLFLLALCSALTAGSWCDLDGCWGVGIEALYWRATPCAWSLFDHVDGVQEEARYQVITVNPSNDWGFRLFGDYTAADSCYLIALDWAYLRTTDVTTEAGLAAFAYGDNVARLKYSYDRVNLRGSHTFSRGECFDFYGYAGVRYLRIRQNREHGGIVDAVPLKSHESSRFSGAAFEIGVGATYHLNCGLNLHASVGPLAAIGEQRHSLTYHPALTEADIQAEYPNRTLPLAGYDLRVGLSGAYECHCYTLVGEIGYELNYYHDALTQSNVWHSGSVNIGAYSECVSVGFGGPYASLQVRF